jgi:integrase
VANIRLEYVKSYIDRHGKVRRYLRRTGHKSVPLPGLPGSEEFMLAYSAALSLLTPTARIEPGAPRTKAGSVSAMIVAYQSSGDFQICRGSTRAQYHRILEMLRRDFGDLSIAKLERRHAVQMLQDRAQTPTVARTLLRILRGLIAISMDLGLRASDPTVGLRVKLPKSDGHPTWDDTSIAGFENTYPLGSKPRLALALLLNTAGRCSDVVRLGPGNVRNGKLVFTAQKNGVRLVIPMLPETVAAIAAMPASEHMVFLTNMGAAFTAETFSKWFVRQRKRAGLPAGLSAHGLRKASCKRLAEVGCTEKEIAAILGDKSLAEIVRYTRAAEQERLAENAMAKLQAPQKGA